MQYFRDDEDVSDGGVNKGQRKSSAHYFEYSVGGTVNSRNMHGNRFVSPKSGAQGSYQR